MDLRNFEVITDLTENNFDLPSKGFSDIIPFLKLDEFYELLVPNNSDGVPFGKVILKHMFAGTGDHNVLETNSILDLTTLDTDLKGFQGGFSMGKYAYLVPYNNGDPFGKLVRIEVNPDNFPNSSVSVLDLTTYDPDLKGFYGGFTDGRYGYLVPNYSSKFVRVNLNDFSTVDIMDLFNTDSSLRGFHGWFIYNNFAYLFSQNNSKVVKINLMFNGT